MNYPAANPICLHSKLRWQGCSLANCIPLNKLPPKTGSCVSVVSLVDLVVLSLDSVDYITQSGAILIPV